MLSHFFLYRCGIWLNDQVSSPLTLLGVISEADSTVWVNQGDNVQLRCPINTPIVQPPESLSMAWFFHDWADRNELAKLRIRDSVVVKNITSNVGKFSFSSHIGELTIANVDKNNAGLYDCKIREYPSKTVLLEIRGKCPL